MDESLIKQLDNACEEVSRQIVLKSHATAELFAISPSDFEHLSLLIKNGPFTAGQLATMTGLTTGAVTGVIDRLEENKLVQRQHDQTDRRRIIVIPTTRAVKHYKALYKQSDEGFARCLSAFSSTEQRTILKFLNSTTNFLREQTALLK